MNYADVARKHCSDECDLFIPKVKVEWLNKYQLKKNVSRTQCKCRSCDDTECHAHYCDRCGHTNANHLAEECYAARRVDGRPFSYIDSIGVIVLRKDGNAATQILLQHRSPNLMHGTYKLGIIGGCLEKYGSQCEDIQEGALREFNEELELNWSIDDFTSKVVGIHDLYSTRYFILKYDIVLPKIITNQEVSTDVWREGHVWVNINQYIENYLKDVPISNNVYACKPRTRKILHVLSEYYHTVMLVLRTRKGNFVLPNHQIAPSTFTCPFHLCYNTDEDTINNLVDKLCDQWKIQENDRRKIKYVTDNLHKTAYVTVYCHPSSHLKVVGRKIGAREFIPWQRKVIESI